MPIIQEYNYLERYLKEDISILQKDFTVTLIKKTNVTLKGVFYMANLRMLILHI